MKINAFFDEVTFTVTYVVADSATSYCAIIDSVLDFDPKSGHTSTESADKVIEYVKNNSLTVHWVLETHAHADHLSAAQYLKQKLGGQVAIGAHIVDVQTIFGEVFNAEAGFATDGSQFDRLFSDGDTFKIGDLTVQVLHTPGHTPACLTYVVGDAAFVGDTLFMPDYGTARVDFPGGDASTLYSSIHRILALPDSTRLYMCHDYLAPGRDQYAWETTVAEEREHNVHVGHEATVQDFISLRTARDRSLAMPRLLLPSVQVNMRAGHLPPPEGNGVSYLKIPINAL